MIDKNDEVIKKNRLWHFRQIAKSAGGTNATADILEVRSTTVTGILGPSSKRSIGDRLAQKIETKFGLKPGYLDQPIPEQSRDQDPFISEIVATLSVVSQADKEFVLGMSQWIAKRSTSERSTPLNLPGKIDLVGEASQMNYDLRDIDSESKKEESPLLTNIKSTRSENARKQKGGGERGI